MKVELRFGALSPTLKEQFLDHGLDIPDEILDPFQKDAKALVRVHLRNIITSTEYSRATKRLGKKVFTHLQELEDEE